MHCKISSKRTLYKIYIKKQIVNQFLNSLESASFQLLKEKGRSRIIIVTITHNLILYLGLVKFFHFKGGLKRLHCYALC